MVTAQFLSIGSDTMPLSSFVPTGDDTSDSVVIQTLDAAGYTIASYSWVNWAGDNYDQEAWIEDGFAIVEGVSFAPGQGLWVQGADESQGIQTAGMVGTSDVVVKLRFGSTATGNPFPVAINLQDILPEGDDTSDSVVIQTLDAAGYTIASYSWVNWAGENFDQEAWIDDSFTIVNDVTFAPGQGLWIQGAGDNQSVRFPAPEL